MSCSGKNDNRHMLKRSATLWNIQSLMPMYQTLNSRS